MKFHNRVVTCLLIVFSVFNLNIFNLLAAIAPERGCLLFEEDSTEIFTYNILEPTIASYIPHSLKRVEHISDETDVVKGHKALSNALSLKTLSLANAETTSGSGYSVGQISYSSSVSPSGGRIYSVPIPVAAGWHTAPQVSLCYNSQSGNGAAGYGWDISGISAIEIRNKNYYYDGRFQHSAYDSNSSVYSLDGVPIVTSSLNVGDYAYATTKGNLQIKKHFSTSGVLSYFTVLYPDGRKGTFGYTDNSSYRTIYPLTKIEDINGNAITFNYAFWGGHYYITSITYGESACITFQYESRSDVGNNKYRAGLSGCYPFKRITSILSEDGGTEICHYTLKYEYKDKVSLLREIGCVSDGMSYSPLSFLYGVDSEQDTEEAFSLREQNFFLKYFTRTDDVDIIYKRGKFIPGGSNDGIIMLPDFENYGQIDSEWRLFKRYYKYGSTYSKDQTIICNLSAVEHTYQFEIKAGEGFQTIEAVDVNGDGMDELVKINNSCTVQDNTDFNVYIYSFDRYGVASCDSLSFRVLDGTHNTCFNNPAQCDYYFGDFRGTGKKMLLVATRNKSKFALIDLDTKCKIGEQILFTMSDEAAGLIFAADFENDGQDDLCYVTDDGMDVYSILPNSGSMFNLKRWFPGISKSLLFFEPNLLINGSPAEIPGTPYLLDINGDGYLDIAYAPNLNVNLDGVTGRSSTWNISIFDGKRFSTQSCYLRYRLEDDKIVFMDVDKDGLPDMLHFQEGKLYLVPNVNGIFQYSSSYVNINTDDNAELIPCDVSTYWLQGEILTVAGPYVNVYAFNVNHSTNRLLTRFKDSFGVQYNNTYGDVSQNDGAYLTDYSRSYDSDSGFMRKRLPLALLYGANTIAGGDLVANEYYTYYDAVFNVRGLGFCGFGKTKCTDYAGGYVTLSEQDPEKMGVQVRVSKALLSSAGSPFEETVNTYDDHTTIYGKLNPRLTVSKTVDDLSGVTTETKIKYDSYDYPTLTSITKSSSSSGSQTEKQSKIYEHSITEDKYVLGVIKKQSVAKDFGSMYSGRFWNETSVLTYDDYYRPLTKKDYVVYEGIKLLPISDSLVIPPKFNELAIGVIDIPRDSLPSKPGPRFEDTYYLVSETEWTYDSFGNVISEKKAPYGVTSFTENTYTYDEAGRYLISSTNPLGQTTTYSGYNKFGKPTSLTDYRGRMTVYKYDEWGNQIKCVHPDGTIEETILDWGGQGLYTVTKIASGSPNTVSHFDALGREVRTGNLRFDDQWQYVDKIYDTKGRLQKESLPFRDVHATYWNEIEYDQYDRKIRFTEPSGKLSTWSYNGTSVSSSLAGIESTKTYDAVGNLISVSDAGGTVTYTLRNDGQVLDVSVTGGLSTRFEYDVYGRRKKIVDPSAGTQTDTVVYNNDGSSIATHTNPNGSVVTYVDRYGRTTKIERPGEYNTEYVYDSNGLLTSEESSNGTSKSYTYDYLDRVLTLTETVPDGKWLKKTFAYSSEGKVRSITYETQNGVITTEDFVYSNGTNVGIELRGTPVRFINAENDLGQPTSVSTGGIIRTYSYNAYGMPIRRTMGDVMDYSFSFDPLTGNLLGRTDNLRNQTEAFAYDAMNRLVAIDDRMITYSDNGNITRIDSVGDMSYDNSSRPYQVTSLAMEGNVVPSRVQNVAYTCYSRPSIMTEGGRSAAFTYNGDGARVKMNVSNGAASVLSRYYIGERYELDVTPNGTTERLYLGGDAYSAPMVYVRDGSGTWTLYNIGRDYLGNITHIATSDGTLVEENSYDPWGRLRDPETKEIYAPGTEPGLMLGRGYTGHEHLTWFGLINMNARLYDPVLGRFLSPDPFVQMPDFTQNFNRYSYCLNNPLAYVDENGELWHIIIGGAIGAVINLVQNKDTIDSVGEFLMVFGVGFASGALSTAVPQLAAAKGLSSAATLAASTFASSFGDAMCGASKKISEKWGSGESVEWDMVGKEALVEGIAGIASNTVALGLYSKNPLQKLMTKVNPKAAFVLSSTLYSSVSGAVGNVTRGTMYNAMGDNRGGNMWSFALRGAAWGAAAGAISSTTYLLSNYCASNLDKSEAVKPIGTASEGVGSYVYDSGVTDSIYGGELNAIYVTAGKKYYNVQVFVPNPIHGAVPIKNVYQVLL